MLLRVRSRRANFSLISIGSNSRVRKKARAPTDSRHSIVIPPPDRGSPRPCPYLYPIYPCAAQAKPIRACWFLPSLIHLIPARGADPGQLGGCGSARHAAKTIPNAHCTHDTCNSACGRWMDRYRTRTAT
jgi:hypothetical protein